MMFWLIIAALALFALAVLFALSLCWVAGEADRLIEEWESKGGTVDGKRR